MTLDEALNSMYAAAVALHESIRSGKGATGWDEDAVRSILTRYAASVREEALEEAERALLYMSCSCAKKIRALKAGKEE